MSKISENISEELELATKEAIEKINNKPRKRRGRKKKTQVVEVETKDSLLKCNDSSHIIAIVQWDQDKDDDNKLPREVEIPDSILVNDYDIETISNYLSDTVGYCHKGFSLEWPEHSNNLDDICQWEIEKAHINQLERPDFDFRLFYVPGDKVYLVRYYESLKSKELIYTTLRTVYARLMVGTIEQSHCQCIGFSDKDNIFINRQDALDYFNSIEAETLDEYNEETGKKKRGRKKKENVRGE